MTIKTIPWNSGEYLETEEEIQLYLEACLEEAGDDFTTLIHALSIIARAKNMSQIAQDSGLTTERLDQALSPDSNPTFATVAKALGFRLTIEPELRTKDKSSIS